MTAERAYGGVSAAERRAARRERLVEAVLDVAGADGAGALTVTAVCRKAGLNERYFYESFADRSEALAAAADHVAQVLVARMLEGLSAAPDEQEARARAAVGAAVDVLTEDPRKGSLFLEAGSSPVLAERRRALTGTFIELMLSQALATLHLPRTPAVEKAGLFAATHLFGGTLETIGAFLGGQLQVSRDELVEMNVQMFLAAAGRVEHLFEQE